MPQIRANRESIDDRYSVLGFTIRTKSPLFEVGITTDPALFRIENKNQRQQGNFYSSRVGGAIRAHRGEAVYLVPPQVLSNFIGNSKLYFGLATFSEESHGTPNFVRVPDEGHMYVDIRGLTGRGLRRMISSVTPPAYGNIGSSPDPSIQWGGDALPQTSASPGIATPPSTPDTRNTAPTQAPTDSLYDDGFGPFPPPGNNIDTQVDNGNNAVPSVAHPPVTGDQVSNAPSPTAPIDPSTLPADSLASNHLSQPLELIRPFYDPADPSSALMSQNNAFSAEREEWFAGVPNTQLFPHSAICQLIMTAPDGRQFQGTGFYIANNRVLTCAHNLSGKSSVTIIPARNGTDNKPYNEVSVNSSSWRIAPGYTGSGDYDNDLAVIDNVPLAAPNGNYFNFLLATPSDQMPIVVCGYSAGSRLVPELNQIIDGDMQHLHGGYVRDQNNLEVIDYPILTLKGASGSPVYHLSSASGQLEALIAGVHVSGEPAASGLNRGCFITPTKIDWIEGRTTSFALSSAQCRAENTSVNNHSPQTSRQLAIPLDPGEGGRSISIDALQPGDIIVSTARHIVSYAIRLGTLSAISHASLYVGDGNVIEAVGEGVREVPVEQAVGDALVAVAYRDPRVTNDFANAIVSYARSRVGNPYNYAGVGFIGYRILNPGGAAIINAIGQRLGLEIGQAGAVYCSELVFAAYENANIPLGNRPATSTPSDIVDLFGERLNYVGHLMAIDVPLGIPLSQATNNSSSLGSNGFSIHWDSVPYQPQSSVASCWAASAAMIVGWRDLMSISDSEIAAKVPAIDAYKNGLWPQQRQMLADVWDLVAEPPASYTIDAWRNMLETFGPLYIDMTSSGDTGAHARVLVGMASDSGATDGSDTVMYMYDPWPEGAGKVQLPFAQFLALYEGRTGNSGGYLQYQILHSAEIPDTLRPVTVAPFSMPEATPDSCQHDVENKTPQLTPAPDSRVQQQLNSGVSRPMEAATVAIASVVAGAVMERLVNNQGDIKWELDQLRGLKHPNDTAPSPLPPAHNGEIIRLTDWPMNVNGLGDEISAGFEVNWQYNGRSVGNVMISNVATNDAVGWGLIIKAKIMDDNIVYPQDSPEFSALRIRFEYRFTRTIGSDLIAIRDLHLFANGRYNISGRWEQT